MTGSGYAVRQVPPCRPAGAVVSRSGWTLVIGAIVLLLAWWGLRMLWWRMNYMVPAFGLGLIAGVALTLWLVRPRR